MRLPESRGVARLVALLLALSLGAAACGSGETTNGTASASDAPASEAPDDSDSSDSDGQAGDSQAGETSDGTSDEADAGSDESAAAVNLFPDVDVVNISDGSTINLAAELGGGDTPVLLWFFAPH